MDAALLSRFDLVFILVDRPDENMDRFLSEHVMQLHAGKDRRRAAQVNTASPVTTQATQRSFAVPTLQQRLKSVSPKDLDLIPHILLRRYLAYARRYIHPR